MKTCYWVRMLMAHQMEAIVSDVLSSRMDSKRGHCPCTWTGKTAAIYTAHAHCIMTDVPLYQLHVEFEQRQWG